MSEPNTALAILQEAKKLFPREHIPPETLAKQASELADIPPPALALIVRQLYRSREFFPGLAAIRNAYIEAVLPDAHAASYQWVRKAMKTGEASPYTGRVAKPTEWPDELTRLTVEAIGWAEIYTFNDYQRERTYREEYQRQRNEKISAANRGSMLDLGVAAIGEGSEMRVTPIALVDGGGDSAVSARAFGTDNGLIPTRFVTDDDPHLETMPPRCYYCGQMLGEPHRYNCERARS